MNNQSFNNILNNLAKSYQQKYGVAVFSIEVKNTKSGIVIKGKVLTENQRDEILEEFKKNKIKIKIKIKKENIKVLSDANFRNEIGWAVVENKIIDLKSRFVSGKIINGKILNRIRCSQALKGEVLRVLHEYENQLLVQQSDLTLGWVDKDEVIVRKNNSSPDKGRLGGVRNRRRLNFYKGWKKGNYAVKGEIIKVTNKKVAKRLHSLEARTMEPAFILKEAEKYLGVKYVPGGKSKNGIDCSGLVQVAYKNSLGIILPKHSWDQKEMGVKIDLENIKTGDLVFLIKKKNGHRHVGIAEICENAKRLHGSEAETMKPAISSVISSISEKSAVLDISTNLDFSRGLEMTVSGQPGVNLIHASLDEKKVVREELRKVFENYEFVEARRIISL